MYGKRRFARKSTSRRASGTFGGRRSSALRKVGARFVTKRRVANRLARREIKYDDDYMNLAEWVSSYRPIQGNDITVGGHVNYVLGGVIKTGVSSQGLTVPGGIGVPKGDQAWLSQTVQVPNCLTNVDSGTTASTRIGNMIQPRYLTIKGVLTASRTNLMNDPEATTNQTGVEGTSATAQARFIRTSVKLFIIRDKSMNEKGFVEYSDVFAEPMQTAGGLAGAGSNPFLFNRKIDTIGRYDILKQVEYQLDQDDPQKSFTHVIPLKGVAIRFNGAVSKSMLSGTQGVLWAGDGTIYSKQEVTGTSGPQVMYSADAQSMTNGIYILAVSHSTTTTSGNSDGFKSPQLVMSSRLTFED